MNTPNHLDIRFMATDEEISSCYEVLSQLRPHFTKKQDLVKQIQRQQERGYKLASCIKEENVVAVIGFRFLEFLSWGKVLYIDDLITDREEKRKGYAGVLLKWVIELAKKEGCDQVHLDSGYQRYDAHRLYLNHGFKITCHHFALDCKTSS